MSYPKYSASGMIVAGDWDAITRNVLNRGGAATAVVGFNADLAGRENYFPCDGTADNIQIQAAIDYIDGLGGGSLYAEAGTYVSATEAIIDVPEGIVIEGSSDKTVTFENIRFLFAASGTDEEGVVFRNFNITGSEIGYAITIDADDCTISNVLVENIEVTITGATGRTAFQITSDNTSIVENVRFINCKAIDCSTFGFMLFDDTSTGTNIIRDIWFIACEAINCGKASRISDWVTGFDFSEGDASLTVENIFAVSCKATGNWESGFHNETAPTHTNVWYVNCTSNENGLDKGAPTFAAGFLVSGEASVVGCKAYGNGFYGIHMVESLHATITGNTLQENVRHGIFCVTSSYCNIEDNLCIANDSGDSGTYDGIYIYTDSDNITLVGNTCTLNDRHGIWIHLSDDNLVTGNACTDNTSHGIYLFTALDNTVTGNTCTGNTLDGIHLATASLRNTITGNICSANTVAGLQVAGASDNNTITGNTCTLNTQEGMIITSSDNNTITGNTISENIENGIFLYEALDNTVSGNSCNGNDSGNTGTYNGIRVDSNSNDNIITGNTCNDNDEWGIRINNGNCNRNWLKNNQLRGNTSGPLRDIGTDTKLAIKTFQFIAGGDVEGTAIWASFVSTTASAKGWSVAGADDWAVALSQLPLELQQIVRFKIWAVALGAPINAGGQMHLEIVMNAGADNLAFTTEPVALANFDGVTTDYVNTDVVHWTVDSGDDADIASMVGGMSLEVKVIYETGSDPDGATNAVFRTVEIEYV